MATLVQATCPGCKKLLHIPKAWLSQPIRCKFCGLVMAAKNPPAPGGITNALPPQNKISTSRAAARRNPKGPAARSWSKGPLVLLLLLGIAGGAGAFFWKPISERFRKMENNSEVAKTDGNESKEAVAQSDEKKPPTTPPKPKPVKTPETPKTPQTNPVKPIETPKSPEKDPAKKPDLPKDPVKVPEKKPDLPKEKDPVKKPDLPKDPPKDPVKMPDPAKVPPKDAPKTPQTTPDPIKNLQPPGDFPRRALVISVHNYYFANPTQFGPGGANMQKPAVGRHRNPAPVGNINDLCDALVHGLHVPESQIYLLSDLGRDPHPPMRLTIEETLTAFLGSSRAQDSVMVFFVGHAVEVDGVAYLAPIEGDIRTPSTLIELDWVLKRMETCKARQKVLVLDGNRFSPTMGFERPGAGPMTEKFDAKIKTPPPGVEIWSACVAGQQSYEPDSSPMGIFLDSMRFLLSNNDYLYGKNQQPKDLIDLEALNKIVFEDPNGGMKKELASLKLTQTPRVTGKPAIGGAPYDPEQSFPPSPVAVIPPNQGGGRAKPEIVKAIFTEVLAPPVRATKNSSSSRYDSLPFSQTVMENYTADEKPHTELPKFILQARAALWAVSPQKDALPADVREEVVKIKADLGVDLSRMVDGYAFQEAANENQFKGKIENQQRDIAKIIGTLTEVYGDLKTAGKKMRKDETKRWQANYDLTVARMEAQIAYVYEYQSMLGQMRKELPPKEANQRRWVLASSEILTGDSAGKKLAASSRKLLEQIATDNAGTPWEVLARREKSTALGLEWKGSR